MLETELLEQIEKQETVVTQSPVLAKPWAKYLVPAICFVVALTAALLNNFYGQDAKVTLIFDSRHYLETTRLLVLWLQDSFAKGDFFSSLATLNKTQPWFAEYLILDGPVLPFVTAIVFSVLGKVPQQTDWRVLVSMFSVLQAVSALLVAVLMQRWVKNSLWGLTAGLIWALYPPAIIASGRYLTETPAVTLLLACILGLDILVQQKNQKSKSLAVPALAVGLADGLMFLLKPVLLPMWGMAHLIAFLSVGWKKRMVIVSLTLCGMAAILLPWLATTAVVTGQMQLLPQRVPAYNVAKGCDVEVDGWGVMPSVPLTNIFAEEKSSVDAALGIWTTRPLESLNLILRKATRMWLCPWNDFRQHPLTLPLEIQKWCHWLLLLSGIGGFFALLTLRPANRASDFIGIASVSILMAHLIYMPFETITRYGFTAMPFVVLLAVYFIETLSRLGKLTTLIALAIPVALVYSLASNNLVPHLVACGLPATTAYALQLFVTWLGTCWFFFCLSGSIARFTPRIKQRTALSLLGMGCVITGLIFAGLALNDKQVLSWSCPLNPGQSVCRAIDLANSHLRSAGVGGVLILIDGDEAIQGAKLTVNGQVLSEKPVHLWQFRPDYYWVFDIMRKYASAIGFPLDNLHQWYAVSVPLSYLHLSGGNVVVLSADEKPLSVIGEYSHGSEGQFLQDLGRFSPGQFCNDDKLMDGSVCQPISKRFVPSVSSLELSRFGNYDDLSPESGKQTGEYHLYLATFFNPNVTGADAGLGQRQVTELGPKDFDPVLRVLRLPDLGKNVVGISKPQFQCARKNTVEVSVPQSIAQASHVIVSISGKKRSLAKTSSFSLLPAAVGGKDKRFVMVLPHTPAVMEAHSEWEDFAITEEIPVAAMQGYLHELQIGLYPGPWEQVSEYGVVGSYGQTLLKDLKVTFTANNRKNYSGKVPVIF